MQENPRSEPEVAESSKNGLPFIRTVISTCHWGKKLGLMTKIGGGRNFENKIRGVETLKIIYYFFMVRIDGKRLCMNKKGSKSSKNVILGSKI